MAKPRGQQPPPTGPGALLAHLSRLSPSQTRPGSLLPLGMGCGLHFWVTTISTKCCSASGSVLWWWDMAAVTAPSLLPAALAVGAALQITAGCSIVPMGSEKVGAVLQLCCVALLCPQSAIARNAVIRHNLQSLQLFGIPAYWLTDRICGRLQQTEHSNYRSTRRGKFKS